MKTDLTQYSTEELFSELMSRQDIPYCHVFKRVGSLWEPPYYEFITKTKRTKSEWLADEDFDRGRDFMALVLA